MIDISNFFILNFIPNDIVFIAWLVTLQDPSEWMNPKSLYYLIEQLMNATSFKVIFWDKKIGIFSITYKFLQCNFFNNLY